MLCPFRSSPEAEKLSSLASGGCDPNGVTFFQCITAHACRCEIANSLNDLLQQHKATEYSCLIFLYMVLKKQHFLELMKKNIDFQH